MNLINIHTEQMLDILKKLLLVFGLIAVFASVIAQNVDDFDISSASQSSVVQLDKDSNRDVGDVMTMAPALSHQLFQVASVYYFYSTGYQEPALLLPLRPPNA